MYYFNFIFTDSFSSSNKRQKSKKHHSNDKNKQKSLSPLSKRMAIMDEQNPSSTTRYQFNQPFHLASASTSHSTNSTSILQTSNPTSISNIVCGDDDDYDQKVKNKKHIFMHFI